MRSHNILLVAAICLVAGLAVFLAGFALLSFDPHRLPLIGDGVEQSYVFQPDLRRLEVEVSEVQVELIPSPDDSFRLTYRENAGRLYRIEEDSHRLQVKGAYQPTLKDYLSVLGFYFNGQPLRDPPRLTIAVPVDFPGQISVDSANAPIIATGISASILTFSTINSPIRLTDVQAGWSLDCQTGNGAIELGRAEVGNRLTAVTSNGAISGLVVGRQEDFSLDCQTSNGQCSLPAQQEGGLKMIRLHTTNADIEVSFSQQ